MATKLFLTALLLLLQSGVRGGGDNDKYPCIQNLMPCAPYLKSPSPPASCCIPLKAAVDKDSDCLCNLFNNQALLKNFNVTQDEALKLPKNCGANADLDKCKTNAGGKGTPPPSTPTPPTPTPPTLTPNTPSKTPTKSSSSSCDLSTISAAAMLVASGILYLTLSLI